MNRTKSLRPDNLHIIERKIAFDFKIKRNQKKYWNDDLILTHFFNAFQQTFPEGERLFIEAAMDCIKKYAEKNPMNDQLTEDYKLFRNQEVRHGQIHKIWTEKLIDLGYDGFLRFNQKMVDFRHWFRKRFNAKFRLAFTAAAEHYTAALAFLIVHVKPEVIARSNLPYRGVILYHSMEELEHKGVCFDLFKHFSGSYLIRVIAFLYLSLDLFLKVYKRFRYLLIKDGIWNANHKRQTIKFLLGKQGLLRLTFLRIMSYLLPSFHPWRYDDRIALRKNFQDVMHESGIADFQF